MSNIIPSGPTSRAKRGGERELYIRGSLLQDGDYFGVWGRILGGRTTTNYEIQHLGTQRRQIGCSQTRRGAQPAAVSPGGGWWRLRFLERVRHTSYIIFFTHYMENIIYHLELCWRTKGAEGAIYTPIRTPRLPRRGLFRCLGSTTGGVSRDKFPESNISICSFTPSSWG